MAKSVARQELLNTLDWGNPVAEDDDLSRYFVKIGTFDELTSDKVDLVLGTKGSGKTALLKFLLDVGEELEDLQGIKLLPAVNLKEDSVFKRFKKEDGTFTEQEYSELWKIFFITLLWSRLKGEAQKDRRVAQLGNALLKAGIPIDAKSDRDLLEGFMKWVERLPRAKKIMLTPVPTPQGITLPLPTMIEFEDRAEKETPTQVGDISLDYSEVFQAFDEILEGLGYRTWILVDRLDDVFLADPETEVNALRGLLHAFKDFSGYKNFRIKLFLRDDIYDKITHRGFRGLTHVASRASSPIEWTKEKMLDLVYQRIMNNQPVVQGLGLATILDREQVFYKIFPKQVDTGSRKSDTFSWMINRIKDGNGTFTPREMIQLLRNATKEQREIWARNPPEDDTGPLIEPVALKKALRSVSQAKLKTYLYAEFSHLREHIEKFKEGKAEHNAKSLQEILGSPWQSTAEQLRSVGFLEYLKQSATYKVPFLYREALSIKQGKAF